MAFSQIFQTIARPAWLSPLSQGGFCCKHSARLALSKRPPFKVRSLSTDMSTTTKIVEHTVFFKVKEGVPPEKAEAMVNGLRDLKSLDGVIHLSAGPSLHISSGQYTHALHSFHKSKEALAHYSSHQSHLDVVHNLIFPITDDILALDWESDIKEAEFSIDIGAVRVVALKLKPELPKEEVPSLIKRFKDYNNLFPDIKQASVGENFSPGRAKGFHLGFAALFPSVNEVQKRIQNEELKNLTSSKVQSFIEDFVMVDYAVI